jgi:lipoate-protein ligase A
MYHLPLTLETPAANLALDEALVDAAEAGDLAGEILRLWEPAAPFVVLGRSSPAAEVRLDACRRDGVPVLRRSSGGGTVVAGPGCLMYAVVLDLERRPELRAIDRAHRWVLERLARRLSTLGAGVACAGTSDLVLPAAEGAAPKKIAGNSLRLRRRRLLYHGAILYDFPLHLIGRWLAAPTRTPDYRQGRAHDEFVANLAASREAIVGAIIDAWEAHDPLDDWPRRRTEELAATRYATIDWSAPPPAAR